MTGRGLDSWPSTRDRTLEISLAKTSRTSCSCHTINAVNEYLTKDDGAQNVIKNLIANQFAPDAGSLPSRV